MIKVVRVKWKPASPGLGEVGFLLLSCNGFGVLFIVAAFNLYEVVIKDFRSPCPILYHLKSWHGDKKSEQCHVKKLQLI
ncbi:hypothetical protein A0V43_04230 [Geobacillus sp. JS12]|nr:hypothetical protein A0V43_04230 [Geobacillus sp. JS12]